MKRSIFMTAFFAITALFFSLFPSLCFAQSGTGLAGSISGLQPVLDNVYNEMLPMCGELIGVARGLAGFGAL